MEIIEFKKNETFILGLRGRLDALSAPTVREKLLGLIDQGEKNLLLDCSALDYVSSAGLRVLFEAAFKLEDLQGRIACCSVNADVKKIFEMVELPAEIPVFATQSEALG